MDYKNHFLVCFLYPKALYSCINKINLLLNARSVGNTYKYIHNLYVFMYICIFNWLKIHNIFLKILFLTVKYN